MTCFYTPHRISHPPAPHSLSLADANRNIVEIRGVARVFPLDYLSLKSVCLFDNLDPVSDLTTPLQIIQTRARERIDESPTRGTNGEPMARRNGTHPRGRSKSAGKCENAHGGVAPARDCAIATPNASLARVGGLGGIRKILLGFRYSSRAWNFKNSAWWTLWRRLPWRALAPMEGIGSQGGVPVGGLGYIAGSQGRVPTARSGRAE